MNNFNPSVLITTFGSHKGRNFRLLRNGIAFMLLILASIPINVYGQWSPTGAGTTEAISRTGSVTVTNTITGTNVTATSTLSANTLIAPIYKVGRAGIFFNNRVPGGSNGDFYNIKLSAPGPQRTIGFYSNDAIEDSTQAWDFFPKKYQLIIRKGGRTKRISFDSTKFIFKLDSFGTGSFNKALNAKDTIKTLTSVIAGTSVNAGTSVTAGSTVTATGNITSTTGNISSTTGNVTANKSVFAGDSVNAVYKVNAGTSVNAKTTVNAKTSVNAGTNVNAVINVNAGNNVNAVDSVIAGTLAKAPIFEGISFRRTATNYIKFNATNSNVEINTPQSGSMLRYRAYNDTTKSWDWTSKSNQMFLGNSGNTDKPFFINNAGVFGIYGKADGTNYLAVSKANRYADITNEVPNDTGNFISLQNNNGQVGIGSFSTANKPLSKLHVKGTSNLDDAVVTIEKTNTSSGPLPRLHFKGSYAGVFAFDTAGQTDTTSKDFWFMSSYKYQNRGAATLKVFGPATSGDNVSSGLDKFISLSHDGTMGVINARPNSNTSSSLSSISILPNGGQLLVGTTTSNNGGYACVINGTGYISGGAWTASDQRLKTNIKPLISSINTIKLLKPKSYNFTADTTDGLVFDKRNHLGFLAQDLEKVVPEAVRPGMKGYLAVNYSMIIPVLVKAMQEQQAIIDSLSKVVANLKPVVEKPAVDVTTPKGAVLQLLQNVPNPTTGKTDISYVVPSKVTATLEVHDLNGNSIGKWDNLKNSNIISIDLSGNMPGVYIYTLYADGCQPVVRSMILAK